jgi:hypothetical protein
MFHVSIQLPLHHSYNGIMHTTCHDNVGKMFQIYMCLQCCIDTVNLYRMNVTASVTQPCTRCWPDVTAAVTPRMHEVSKLSPCLLETETQTNCTLVPTTGLAFVKSYYVIYGGPGFDIICVCT